MKSVVEFTFDVGHTVAYNPKLVKYLGSINAVILFKQLLYWTGKESSPLGIYKTAKEIQDETELTVNEQVSARKKLRDLGVLSETRRRIEHRIYYKLDVNRLNEIVAELESVKTAEPEQTKLEPLMSQSIETVVEDVVTPDLFDIVQPVETPVETVSEASDETVLDESRGEPEVMYERGPDAYESAYSLYPTGTGTIDINARAAWKKCVADGVDEMDMLFAVMEFSAFCKRKLLNRRDVMPFQTFFGRDKHYATDWTMASVEDSRKGLLKY
ncbi:hypothetical protein [Paraburkholderia terrae]|uniref:hypothetical protein n=1 Tax=Paraburkholderia terrae TaxID=311230 RepID=UPI0020531E19|nr:hypothetical protein [Paraburkholderia terrae]BDC37927.1 hypothetical protein PTKU15_12240 [Paraburkholderia terrae]